MSTTRRNLLRTLAVGGLALTLAACGFKPRGSVDTLDPAISPVLISGIHGYSLLHRELEKNLASGGVQVTRDAQQAASRLIITAHESDAFELSFDNRNKVLEVELRESLTFRLEQGKRTRVPEQTLAELKLHFTPKEEVLGKDNERELIVEQMRRNLAGRVVQRLARQL